MFRSVVTIPCTSVGATTRMGCWGERPFLAGSAWSNVVVSSPHFLTATGGKGPSLCPNCSGAGRPGPYRHHKALAIPFYPCLSPWLVTILLTSAAPTQGRQRRQTMRRGHGRMPGPLLAAPRGNQLTMRMNASGSVPGAPLARVKPHALLLGWFVARGQGPYRHHPTLRRSAHSIPGLS